MNIQHSSRSDRWMTPEWIIQKVRNVLVTIDVDPASSQTANETVKAGTYFDVTQDSLSMPQWMRYPSSIYLNPPGGKLGSKSLTGLFWNKLIDHYQNGMITHAIFMAFSSEALQSTQLNSEIPIAQFMFCIPKRRIQFVDPLDTSKCSPSHSNVIVYLPGIVDHHAKFIDEFRSVGTIAKGI